MVHWSIRAAGVALIQLTSLTTSYAAAQAIPEDFVIKLERTSCFGGCPVYSVSIDAKGSVTYDGTKFVRVAGRQTDRIPVANVAALVETIDRIRFFELDDKYRQLITDLPTTFVTVTRDGRSKRIEDYAGAPQSLKDLERQIDETARTARWIGRDEATLPLRATQTASAGRALWPRPQSLLLSSVDGTGPVLFDASRMLL